MIPRGTIRKVQDYYFTHEEYSAEIMRAMKEFFDSSELENYKQIEMDRFDEILFNEWFMYDFMFSDGKSVLQKFFDENPLGIPNYRREIYRDLQENYFGLYEIIENFPLQGFALRSLDGGKVFNVSEFSATMYVEVGDIIIGRVGKVGDHYELVGCDLPVFQARIEKDSVKKLEKMKIIFPKLNDLTPKDIRHKF